MMCITPSASAASVPGRIGIHQSDFAAVGLFVMNVVAVISYPDLSDAGMKDHVLWGSILGALFAYGPGALSLDRWLGRHSKNA